MPGVTRKMKGMAKGGKAKTYPAKNSGKSRMKKSKSMNKKGKY